MSKIVYEGYQKPTEKCGDCKFFTTWRDTETTWKWGTYCGFIAPPGVELRHTGSVPKVNDTSPACSMFVGVQRVATSKGRNVRLDDEQA